MNDPVVRGRFAPSPTGPLHFGSLIAAVGSYLDVRSRNGQWLVRIEDLDPPREQPGATASILRLLESYSLHWDDAVVYQSTRAEQYEAAIDQLGRLDAVYYCGCSRKEIEAQGFAGSDGFVYPGTCRTLRLPAAGNSLRLRVSGATLGVTDRLQGDIRQNLERELGDFILRRRDGYYSYQLAVVVDDALQGITDVCRGTDLMDSTPRQVYLQGLLGYPQPSYLHLPIAVNELGQKLSKQTFARPLAPGDSQALSAALAFLGHPVPAALVGAPAVELIAWGVESWNLQALPKSLAIPSPA